VRRDKMNIFEYTPEELLGTVESVDTSTVIVKVENDDKLRGLQVNHLVSIQSSKIGQHLIGLVSKIIRKSAYNDPVADVSPEFSFNIIKVILIGTLCSSSKKLCKRAPKSCAPSAPVQL